MTTGLNKIQSKKQKRLAVIVIISLLAGLGGIYLYRQILISSSVVDDFSTNLSRPENNINIEIGSQQKEKISQLKENIFSEISSEIGNPEPFLVEKNN